MEFLPLIVMVAIVYAVLIVPQQRRAKSHRNLLSQLEVGDEVLTSAGLYGTITEFDGASVFLAVNDDLEIKVTRESVAERVSYAVADEPG